MEVGGQLYALIVIPQGKILQYSLLIGTEGCFPFERLVPESVWMLWRKYNFFVIDGNRT
jgi:hypothetical protein